MCEIQIEDDSLSNDKTLLLPFHFLVSEVHNRVENRIAENAKIIGNL